MKKNKFFLLKLIGSLLILCFALYIINPQKVLYSIKEVSWKYILLSYLLIILSFICISLRWFFILRGYSRNMHPLPIITTAMRGIFFNSFIPGNLGNDFYRFKSSSRYATGKLTVISLLLQERLMGFAVFLFCYIFFYGLSDKTLQESREITSIFFWCILGLTFLFIFYFGGDNFFKFLRNKCNNTKFRDFCTALAATRFPLGSVDGLAAILLTFFSFFLFVASFSLLAEEMCSNVSFSILCMGLVLVEIVRFLPITVQGIGMREACLAWFFYLSGLSAAEGFAVATLGYVLLALGQIGMYGVAYVLDALQRRA